MSVSRGVPALVAIAAIVLFAKTDEANAQDAATWLASKGFDHRRAQGTALVHATAGDLRRQSARDLVSFLRAIPGIRLHRPVTGGQEVVIDPSPLEAGARCNVGVYLNGGRIQLRQYDLTSATVDAREMRPLDLNDVVRFHDVDGLELYGPESSPVASDAFCGVLLLWSFADRTTVDMPFIGLVEGVTLEQTGATPIQGARITLQPLGLTTMTDRAGRFSIAAIPPGAYEIIAEIPGAPAFRGAIDVKAFGTHTLELRLER